jgi:hypothetical protein
MWNMKFFVIPEDIGARGTKKYLETITGKNSIDSPENSCTRDIAHNEESATI